MSRFEFSRKQRVEIFTRAKGHCEGKDCGAHLKAGEGEYDHILPQSMGGENTVENGQVLCNACHKSKTASEAAPRAKADRVRDKHNGTWKRSSRPIPGSKASGWKHKMNGDVVRR